MLVAKEFRYREIPGYFDRLPGNNDRKYNCQKSTRGMALNLYPLVVDSRKDCKGCCAAVADVNSGGLALSR